MFDWCEWLTVKIILPGVVLLTTVVIISLPFLAWAFFQDSKKPTFELKKDEWECKQATSYTTMIMIGKVMVPQQHTKCILWGER